MPNVIIIHKQSDMIIGAFQQTNKEALMSRFNSTAYHLIAVCDVIYGLHRALSGRYKSDDALVNTKDLMRVSPAFAKAMKAMQAFKRSKLFRASE